MTRQQSVVIVGGGIGGVTTAEALRTAGYDGGITIVDDGEFPYDRPPLSKSYLAGERNADQIALRCPSWYSDHAVRLIVRTSVTALSTGTGEAMLSTGAALRTDRVVLATGGKAARPPIRGIANSRVHVLRTVDDADRLREGLQPGTHLLVIGAGLIGAEVAATAVSLGCGVVLAEPTLPPLAGAVGLDLATWLHEAHARHGIETVNAAVSELRESPFGISAMFEGADTAVTFDRVLLAVGMTPETGLAETAGLQADHGIIVDTNQQTSIAAVLAVGDPVRVRHGGTLAARTEHWDAAIQQAQRAAATILGAPPPPVRPPWFWTDRHGLHVEAVGHMAAATETITRGDRSDGRVAVFGLCGSRVVAVAAVNDPVSIGVGRRMIGRGINVDVAQLADPEFNLKRLVRLVRS